MCCSPQRLMESAALSSYTVGFNLPSYDGLIFICQMVFIRMCDTLTCAHLLRTQCLTKCSGMIEMKNSQLNPSNTKSIEILLQSLLLKLLLF